MQDFVENLSKMNWENSGASVRRLMSIYYRMVGGHLLFCACLALLHGHSGIHGLVSKKAMSEPESVHGNSISL